MNKAERAAEHQRALALIDRIALCKPGSNDTDHEATLLERARMRSSELEDYRVTEEACEAFERLLRLAETRDSGQIRSIALVLAAAWGVKPLELRELRGLDRDIGRDCMSVIAGIQAARIGADDMAEDAARRVPAALRAWGLLED